MLKYFAQSSLLILYFFKHYFTTFETEVSVVRYIRITIDIIIDIQETEESSKNNCIFFVKLNCTSDITFTSSPEGKPAVTALKPRKLLG